MDDKKEPETPPAAKKDSQSYGEIWRESVVDAQRVLENTKLVTGSPRQLVNAALLGTCLLFIAAMLGVQRLDTPLTVALVSFSITIPVLIYGFVFSSYKAKPVRGYLILVAIQLGAWIAEAFGWIAVAVGVCAVIAHLSPLALNAMIITSIIIVVLGFFGSMTGLFVYVWRQVKKQGDKQDKNPPAASGDTPLQTQ